MIRQAQLLVVTQFILFAILAGTFMVLPTGQVLWARLLGLGLLALGLGLVMLSILTQAWVNKNLVKMSPEPNTRNQLVQTGIYAFVRHPIYTGVIAVGLGTALVHGHPVALLIAIIICAFFTYKSTFEERLLMQAYPDYAAYRTRAGRFFPRLLG
ncbi:MAG: isoprenylcysteine carboxylmethyltransferase family protein [Anaerolineae bacterium]|nr:isoprenylcysteine carboxylmethyltransferase family protein [Anaerolineae bacterium]